MAKTIFLHKKMLVQKLLEFEKSGLQKYGKYLDKQLKLSVKKRSHAKYKKHIERQIVLKDKKIQAIDKKLAGFA
ncbi:MAG: hypothetical protein ACHQD8_03780 [Chitinophagales bacterium]